MKNTKKKLSDAIKGMQVKNWEARENSDGKRVVYVRFVPKSPEVTLVVKEQQHASARNRRAPPRQIRAASRQIRAGARLCANYKITISLLENRNLTTREGSSHRCDS